MVDPFVQSALNAFTQWLAGEINPPPGANSLGLSPTTSSLSPLSIEAYTSDVKQILAPITSPFSSVNWAEHFARVSELQSWTPRSRVRRLIALRKFLDFLKIYQPEIIESDLFQNSIHRLSQISTSYSGPDLPKALSEDQLATFFQNAAQHNPYPHHPRGTALHLRDQALLHFLYATGARISETIQLLSLDIHWEKKRVFLRYTKRSRPRVVFVDDSTARLLQHYFQETWPLLTNGKPEKHFFVNVHGDPMTRQNAWEIFQRYCENHVSPHLLRHTFATHLLKRGMNLRALQILLGHSHLSTTQIYTQVEPDHLSNAIEKYHPMAAPHIPQSDPAPLSALDHLLNEIGQTADRPKQTGQIESVLTRLPHTQSEPKDA